jgi:hypothetical protein
VNVKILITDRYQFEEAEQAFKLVRRGDVGVFKVMIKSISGTQLRIIKLSHLVKRSLWPNLEVGMPPALIYGGIASLRGDCCQKQKQRKNKEKKKRAE